MKAAFYRGDRVVEAGAGESLPPGPGEVRLDVGFCGVCGTDMHIYHGHMDARVAKPQILGHEVSATVAALGDGVGGWSVGDRVAVRPLKFGDPVGFDRGHSHVGKNLKFIGIDLPGGMQSSWTVPAYTLHRLPESLSLEHGALIEPAAVACHDVRLGEVSRGETCVVIGGGPIGLLIALVAREKGARVIVSEPNEQRIELVRSLGFDAVNPISGNVVECVTELTSGGMADCVFEVSGSAPGVEVMTELAAVRGRIVMVAIHPQPKPVNLFRFFWSELRLIGARLYEERDFDEAIALAAAGRLMIDRLITDVRPLDEVGDAFAAIDANPDGIKTLIRCS
ncbi:(2R,3R)-2,3-butanediol dehydrogenase [Haloferula helveola]|uniref:(2R,3R)-2,3-butanediol dehydrogenase n=1 Tax=Haloferula helveola TaxID=490095 RepID=A0ABM7R6P2_9BACT|nr:(2R,3R)-2,3-butanediol dehydrogenase [Haloferula helveola]